MNVEPEDLSRCIYGQMSMPVVISTVERMTGDEMRSVCF